MLAGRQDAQDAPVAILLERSIDFVVAVLAILRAGRACLPLDPRLPEKRLQTIFASSRADALVTNARMLPNALRCGPARSPILLDDLSAAQNGVAFEAAAVAPHSPAYALYTSGSTGEPKGVLVPHATLSGLVGWHLSGADFGQWPPHGAIRAARLRCLPAGNLLDSVLRRDPRSHRRDVARRSVEASDVPGRCPDRPDIPSAHGIASARFGGRGRAAPRCASACRLRGRAAGYHPCHQGHGSQACATAFSRRPLPRSDGKPCRGRQHAAWRGGRVAPSCRPSDALFRMPSSTSWTAMPAVSANCISAAIVWRLGYIGRADLTAERFVHDRCGQTRLYRSGDLASLGPDGEIRYHGRIGTTKVKIRGYRVEIGEIEAVLASHPAVRRLRGGGPVARFRAKNACRLRRDARRGRLRAGDLAGAQAVRGRAVAGLYGAVRDRPARPPAADGERQIE